VVNLSSGFEHGPVIRIPEASFIGRCWAKDGIWNMHDGCNDEGMQLVAPMLNGACGMGNPEQFSNTLSRYPLKVGLLTVEF
jgi:hypothetical protein